MSSKHKNNSESGRLNLILGSIPIQLGILVGYYALRDSQIPVLILFLTLYLMLLATIIFPIYVTFSLLINYFKQKKSDVFINPKVQPTITDLYKIIEFINSENSITKQILITKFLYSKKIAKRYLKYLVKNKYIKLMSKSKGFFNRSEKKYVLYEEGISLIEKISNIKISLPKFTVTNFDIYGK